MTIIQRGATRLASIVRSADHLAGRLQGQDVERPDTVPGRRTGRQSAAIASAHYGHGVSTMGLGR